MKEHIESLGKFCGVTKDPFSCIPEALILKFTNPEGVTTIRVTVYEFTYGRYLEITNMTTLPESEKRKGYGSAAIKKLLEWAHEYKVAKITAVQVLYHVEDFWRKNGFTTTANHSNDFIFRQG